MGSGKAVDLAQADTATRAALGVDHPAAGGGLHSSAESHLANALDLAQFVRVMHGKRASKKVGSDRRLVRENRVPATGGERIACLSAFGEFGGGIHG